MEDDKDSDPKFEPSPLGSSKYARQAREDKDFCEYVAFLCEGEQRYINHLLFEEETIAAMYNTWRNGVKHGYGKAEARLESPGHRRFMADSYEDGPNEFDTLDEARESANGLIAYWRRLAADSGGKWTDYAGRVTVWAAIERGTEVVMEKNHPNDADSSDFVLKPLPNQNTQKTSP